MLAPQERVAFVLHDMFDLSFEEIAPIVDRTPEATRQLASRARRRVRGATAPAVPVAEHRELVSTFLAAARDGAFDRLLALLSPDVVMRADERAVHIAERNQGRGAPRLAPEVRGAPLVAGVFNGRAQGISLADIDGVPGAVWIMKGQVHTAWRFTIDGGKVVAIDVIMDPAHIARLDVQVD